MSRCRMRRTDIWLFGALYSQLRCLFARRPRSLRRARVPDEHDAGARHERELGLEREQSLTVEAEVGVAGERPLQADAGVREDLARVASEEASVVVTNRGDARRADGEAPARAEVLAERDAHLDLGEAMLRRLPMLRHVGGGELYRGAPARWNRREQAQLGEAGRQAGHPAELDAFRDRRGDGFRRRLRDGERRDREPRERDGERGVKQLHRVPPVTRAVRGAPGYQTTVAMARGSTGMS